MIADIAPAAGIDIAEAQLDVALHPAGDARQLANDRRGQGELLRWPGKRAVAGVVFAATGSYGPELERRLKKSAVPFARVDPICGRAAARRPPRATPGGSPRPRGGWPRPAALTP
jgi:transposase